MASEFQTYLEELFAPLNDVGFRRMFGGLGIFRDGIMFAMVADDVLYLKVDDQNEASFADEGSEPFVYRARGRETVMSYWRLPERLYDEPEEFISWAESAFAAARRSESKKKKRKKR